LDFLVVKEEENSFAVGHLALAYILAKTSSKLLKTNINIPLIFALSVIQDIDILIPILEHRGPTHSIIMVFLTFIPILAIYHKKAAPYLLALVQHSLIGDYIAGGQVQLLWPITTQYYGVELCIKSQTNIALEWILFITSISIMLKTKDVAPLFKPNNSNLILTIPTFTVLLPTLISFPLEVPPLLILPHLVYLTIFSISIIVDLAQKFKRRQS
jgi:membrane-bound metal-dependent hydrolase YbcI (DUF457 family)